MDNLPTRRGKTTKQVTNSNWSKTIETGNKRCQRIPADTMRSWTRIAVLTAVAICAVVLSSCGKQADKPGTETTFEIDKKYERGPVTFRVKASRKQITIADRITLVLEVLADQKYEVELPKFGDKLEQFGIVDYDTMAPKLLEDSRISYRRSYELEPFLSGDYQIPPMNVRFWEQSKQSQKVHEIQSEQIVIKVSSLLPEKYAQLKIKDLAGPVELPAVARDWLYTAAGAALLLVGAVIGLVVWLGHRHKDTIKSIRIPPDQMARRQLEKLLAEKLVEQGKLKLFYIRLSGILRHYIENRFALHAPEQTTEEFLEEIRDNHVLGAKYKVLLGEFMKHCDMVKFAEHQPTNPQIQKTFDICKNFVFETQTENQTKTATG